MIINEWDISRGLYFVRDLDTDRNMFIGTMDECKQFQIDYTITKSKKSINANGLAMHRKA